MHESKEKQAHYILEEGRMIVPGIQALFGFQLIAIFQKAFPELLNYRLQLLHLTSILSVSFAMALLLTPAAYNRQAEPDTVSKQFLVMSSKMLTWAMICLMIGISFDFYIICRIILHDPLVSLTFTLALFTVFFVLWVAFPRAMAKIRH